MSRMHSDGRGSSGSSKPVNKKAPDWVEYDEEEVRNLVVKLSEEGLQPSQVGMELRDKYGIPSVREITGDTVTDILEENDALSEIPEDLSNLVGRAERIRDHLDENPNDHQSERNLELTESKIRKLASYYRNEGEIPEDWKYIREE